MWGDNSEGQLGLGDSLSEVDKPTRLRIDEKPVHISCGYYHTAIVTGKFARSNCHYKLTCFNGPLFSLLFKEKRDHIFKHTPP